MAAAPPGAGLVAPELVPTVPTHIVAKVGPDMSLVLRPPVYHAARAQSVLSLQRVFVKLCHDNGTAPSMHELAKAYHTERSRSAFEDSSWGPPAPPTRRLADAPGMGAPNDLSPDDTSRWLRKRDRPNVPAQTRALVQWVRWCQTWAVDDAHLREMSSMLPQVLQAQGIAGVTPRLVGLLYPLRMALVVAHAALKCDVVRRTFATAHHRPRPLAEEASDVIRAALADAFAVERLRAVFAIAELPALQPGTPGTGPAAASGGGGASTPRPSDPTAAQPSPVGQAGNPPQAAATPPPAYTSVLSLSTERILAAGEVGEVGQPNAKDDAEKSTLRGLYNDGRYGSTPEQTTEALRIAGLATAPRPGPVGQAPTTVRRAVQFSPQHPGREAESSRPPSAGSLTSAATPTLAGAPEGSAGPRIFGAPFARVLEYAGVSPDGSGEAAVLTHTVITEQPVEDDSLEAQVDRALGSGGESDTDP